MTNILKRIGWGFIGLFIGLLVGAFATMVFSLALGCIIALLALPFGQDIASITFNTIGNNMCTIAGVGAWIGGLTGIVMAQFKKFRKNM